MSNQVEGRLVDVAGDFARFDTLPMRLQRLLRAAPYDYDTQVAVRVLRECGDNVDKAFNALAALFADHRDAELKRVWPGAHPDKGRPYRPLCAAAALPLIRRFAPPSPREAGRRA